MPTVQITMSHRADLALQRFSHRARQQSMTTRRSDWEFRRKPRRKQQRTVEEIQAGKESRLTRRMITNEKLAFGGQQIDEMAKQFHRETGYNNPRWWLRALLQQGHRVQQHRAISDWCAFVHVVREERAAGMSSLQFERLFHTHSQSSQRDFRA